MRKSFIWGFILYFSKVYYFSISEKDGIVATRPTYLKGYRYNKETLYLIQFERIIGE